MRVLHSLALPFSLEFLDGNFSSFSDVFAVLDIESFHEDDKVEDVSLLTAAEALPDTFRDICREGLCLRWLLGACAEWTMADVLPTVFGFSNLGRYPVLGEYGFKVQLLSKFLKINTL